MSDDLPSRPIDGDDVAGSDHGATLLLYDWFKHVTTLSLVTLGGVLTILQGEDPVRPGTLASIIVLVAIAGILGFDGQNRILKARLTGQPLPRSLAYIRPAAVLSYGVGVGVFLSLFMESIA